MSPGRFGPRPFFAIRAYLNFVFWARKVVETFSIQQNVRNGHIYIGLMKQHMALIAQKKDIRQKLNFGHTPHSCGMNFCISVHEGLRDYLNTPKCSQLSHLYETYEATYAPKRSENDIIAKNCFFRLMQHR